MACGLSTCGEDRRKAAAWAVLFSRNMSFFLRRHVVGDGKREGADGDVGVYVEDEASQAFRQGVEDPLGADVPGSEGGTQDGGLEAVFAQRQFQDTLHTILQRSNHQPRYPQLSLSRGLTPKLDRGSP